MHENGFPEAGIVESLQNAKVIEKTNSLLFNITKAQLAKLKEIITSIDIKTKKERTSFFTFKPKNITTNKLLESISKLEDNIEDTNPDLYKTLKTAKELPLTNTIYFHGDSITFNPAKELLTSLDSEEKRPVSKTFYI